MNKLLLCLCFLLLSVAFGGTLYAQDDVPSAPAAPEQAGIGDQAASGPLPPPADSPRRDWRDHVGLGFDLLTLVVYRNDRDFDRSEPAYDYGQDVGLVGTYLRAALDVSIIPELKLHWDAEVGLDIWSRNNPELGLGESGRDGVSLSLKQRELWGEAAYAGFAARIGYQHIRDVSGLFLNHYIGTASFRYTFAGGHEIRLLGGQLPDQTHEGWQIETNTFKNDVFVYGADSSVVFSEIGAVNMGVYGLHDASIVGQARDIGALAVAVALGNEGWDATVALIGELGRMRNSAADASDARILAYGASADGGYRINWFSFRLSGAVLSADDDKLGNDSLAFVWSGKRPGMSILLSENHIRDLGDNLDEKVSSYDGFFWNTQAGIGGADLGLYFHPLDSLTVGLVSAGLWVLNPERALGGKLVALEEEIVLRFVAFEERLDLHLIGGVLIPGKAGAAFVNAIDREATELVGFLQAGVTMRF